MRMLLLLGLALAPALAGAEGPATAASAMLGPEELVRKITSDVLEAIKADKELQAGDREKALALAETKVLPHIDFREMTKLAAGRNWTAASGEQRDKLVNGFRTMLVRTYSSAIDAYRGQSLDVQPVRMSPKDEEVRVRNMYHSPGRQSVPVDYQMLKTPQGWKIYDIVVDGVSLVLTYRTEFDQEVRRNGIDGLIARMKEKNTPQPAR
jgi:phospholipid transport system substrate-binding protein